MKIKFIARVIKNQKIIDAYSRDVDLPFVPQIGMRFKQGNSTRLWETKAGELDPQVEGVVYDFDEECTVILFNVDSPLVSTLWLRSHQPIEKSAELQY